MSEKGLVKRVVKDLVQPFGGLNVVPAKYIKKIRKNARGFPESLKSVKLPKGSYVAGRVGNLCYYVFHDRKVVRHVFPEHMHTPIAHLQTPIAHLQTPIAHLQTPTAHLQTPIARLQTEGILRKQSVPPILPAYNKF